LAYKDLRAFIAELEKRSLLKRVSAEVDWEYEIAGWLRKAADINGPKPALLFENIKGYSSDYRLFSGGAVSYPHVALALGLDPGTTPKEIINVYKERLKRPLPPRLVKDGPVKENVHVGNDVNVLEFPVPWWTPRDGGRYVGTWHGNVTKNPVTGTRNVGMYRVQVLDEKRCGVGFLPFSHMGHHFAQSQGAGKPLEMAIVIGADETIPMVAATGIPPGKDEFEAAGGLREEPMDLVKCATVDLEVPANAELVVEGFVSPDERVPEGPFGEHTGYHGGGVRMRPVFHVTGIMHRSRPIFRGALLGQPITEFHVMTDIINSAGALSLFETVGPEGVLAVHCPPAADSACLAIIQIKPRYVGQARNAGRALISSSVCKYLKTVVLVDDDIDPFDLGQVWWAMATRTQGSRDIEVLPYGTASRSDPSVINGEYTDKTLIDATKKLDYPYNPVWGGHWAPTCTPPKEVMQLVEARWPGMAGGGEDKTQVERLTAFVNREMKPRWEEMRQDYKLDEETLKRERTVSYPTLSKNE
jgi:4-hydroxy-3-polyprenylbenzoate decarboxylase